MRKRVFCMAVLCIVLVPAFAAYADIIVEPENDFYTRHQSQIRYLDRSFIPDGGETRVAVKTEPGATEDIADLESGGEVYIEYSCLYGGQYWGYAPAYSGWVRLDQMLVLYDYVAFAEDNLEKLYEYEGDYAEVREARAALAWPWPGADAYLWSFEDLEMDSLWVSWAYRDEAGREWGFIPYLYGSRNIWICLSDPLDPGIPAFNAAPAPRPWVPETEHTDIRQQTRKEASSPLMMSALLVAGLVLVTRGLLRLV